MSPVDPAAARLAALRAEFDGLFAAPPPGEAEAGVELVVVRAGEERYALRLVDLRGVHRLERLVPLPAGPAGLRGLAGVHGRLVAVFDLAALVGRATSEGGWLALLAGEDALALAFDAVVGVRRVPSAALLPAEGRATGAAIGAAVAPEALDGGTPAGLIDTNAVRTALGLGAGATQ